MLLLAVIQGATRVNPVAGGKIFGFADACQPDYRLTGLLSVEMVLAAKTYEYGPDGQRVKKVSFTNFLKKFPV